MSHKSLLRKSEVRTFLGRPASSSGKLVTRPMVPVMYSSTEVKKAVRPSSAAMTTWEILRLWKACRLVPWCTMKTEEIISASWSTWPQTSTSRVSILSGSSSAFIQGIPISL